MDILVERTQNIIADVQEQIERAEEERRKKLEEEKKRLNRKNRKRDFLNFSSATW